MTSGRTALIREFYNESMNRNWISVLFGNGPDTKTIHSEFFGREKYSHNTYIDFLFNFGIVGFIIIISYIFNKLIKGNFLYLEDNLMRRNVKIVRFICILSALSLSLYSKRLFLLIFLI